MTGKYYGPSIEQISKTARALEDPAYAERLERAKLRQQLLPYSDLDDETIELFADYVEALRKIGVFLGNERLQDALNGNPDRMEEAILAVLEYAEYLKAKHETFENKYHATNCLVRALEDGWKPKY